MKKIARHILILILITFQLNTYGQKKVYAVSKTVSKEFEHNKNDIIEITAQKANVQITGWQDNKVMVICKLIAKNQDVKTARQELTYHKYYINKTGKTIKISNFFHTPRNNKIVHSVLQAEYEIKVPYESQVIYSNAYGRNIFQNLRVSLNATVEYGKIEMTNIKGLMKLNIFFSDLYSNKIYGNIHIFSKHSNINMDDVSGKLNINSRSGDIYINPVYDFKELLIESSKSAVTFIPNNFKNYNYNLETSYSTVILKNEYKKMAGYTDPDNKLILINGSDLPLIRIKTTFENIKIY